MKASEQAIIEMMRNEYDAHLQAMIKELSEKPSDGMASDKSAEDPGDTKKDEKPKDKEPRVELDKISLDTRVTHLPGNGPRGYEYTVVSITSDGASLRSGDGKEITVSRADLEKDYVVD
tara:strand:+ start:134 stop:490 length:357 start_codon:yes stop_codon:yes gene_type:complete